MSSHYTEIVALVEGTTEKIFISDILVPYLAERGVLMTPVIISKPGQKGGDVKFARVKNDIGLHLKQRPDTYLTLFPHSTFQEVRRPFGSIQKDIDRHHDCQGNWLDQN